MKKTQQAKLKHESGSVRRRKGALIVISLAVVALFVWLGINTLGGVKTKSESEDVIAANVQTLEKQEQQTVPDVASINNERAQAAVAEEAAAQETTAEATSSEEAVAQETTETGGTSPVAELDQAAEQQKIMTMEDPDKSTFLSWYNGCAIVGDCIVEGISEADFLNSSIVYGKIGVSVYGSDDLIASMETVYPKKVFLCFGLNDMSHYGENVEKFIDSYRPRIEKIQADLPATDIYLIAVIPVQSQASVGKMVYSSLYNQRLEEFAAEVGVGFINPSFILEQDPSYYGSDGMHVSGSYYYKWLTYLADMAGLSS